MAVGTQFLKAVTRVTRASNTVFGCSVNMQKMYLKAESVCQECKACTQTKWTGLLTLAD